MDINKQEKEILKFWKKDKTFLKSLKKTEKSKPFVFYDGPPFATGLPHYGHILASVLKDAIPRFWTMRDRYVRRVWGWDCHGLPVESIAETALGIKQKKEIEKMGVQKFNEFCRENVLTYVSEWEKVVERIARWTDFKGSYKTMDNEYIESVWWAFKKVYEKGLMYEGEKILMYCSRCETPLSKSEITMDNSYQTVKDDTITVKFKLKKEKAFILAWTTTPWTLPSNLALTVNPEMDYVYAEDKSDKTVYILGKETVGRYFKSRNDFKRLKTIKGSELVGKKYEPLFPYFKNLKNSFRVIPGNFVTAEEGTGIVHTAPAFGEEDYEVCKENNIDFIQPVTESGKFTKEIKDFSKMNIFEANPKIIEFLKKQGSVIKVERKEHEYPFCYRCGTPLMYRAIPSLFIDIQKVKKKILGLNKKINWHPSFLKEGRFQKSVEMAPDWNITRNRFWASAIPIWKCSKGCGKQKVIGSIKELKENAIKLPRGKIDLHKHYLDKVKLKCDCGKSMDRVPEVLDCWFESGAMPFAQFHYPFENKELFKKNFPADFVVEYVGQIRTWFYYMLVISTILFEESPFKNIWTTGTILAEDGSKMSKSKKNFPDPEYIFSKFGVDALRFYLMSSPVMNADDFNFLEKGVEEIYKRVILLFYNTNNFYKLNKRKEKPKNSSDEITDRWILSRLNETGLKVTEFLEGYNTVKACNEIRQFIEDLSTWYVRLNRSRLYEEKEARETFRYVLEEFSKLCAPIMPFVSEIIYQSLEGKESVHLKDWTKFTKKKIDQRIILQMEKVREIVSIGLRERDRAGIGLKWPLKSVTIKHNKSLKKEFYGIIKSQLNVKNIKYSSGEEDLIVKLDTTMTPELESEGYAREVSRLVQAFRKKLGLEKKDKIELIIVVDAEFKKILEKQKEFIQSRTNSKSLETVTTTKETFKNKTGFKIKDKGGEVVIIIPKG